MNKRVKELRKTLKISQDVFSSKINISRSHFALIEGGSKKLTDRVVFDICREFNVNEEWLRTGIGDMFIEPDTFSLDEYAKQKNISNFDLDIIKSYLDFPKELRESIENYFKTKILPKLRDNELSATIEETNNNNLAATTDTKNSIDAEVEAYRKELEAEEKGRILSALEKQKHA